MRVYIYVDDRVSVGGGCDCQDKMWISKVWEICIY